MSLVTFILESTVIFLKIFMLFLSNEYFFNVGGGEVGKN